MSNKVQYDYCNEEIDIMIPLDEVPDYLIIHIQNNHPSVYLKMVRELILDSFTEVK